MTRRGGTSSPDIGERFNPLSLRDKKGEEEASFRILPVKQRDEEARSREKGTAFPRLRKGTSWEGRTRKSDLEKGVFLSRLNLVAGV